MLESCKNSQPQFYSLSTSAHCITYSLKQDFFPGAKSSQRTFTSDFNLIQKQLSNMKYTDKTNFFILLLKHLHSASFGNHSKCSIIKRVAAHACKVLI